MGLYARYLLPRLTDLTMSRKLLLLYRQRVIGGAVGRVLEIGIGSGLNLPLYGDTVEEVIGVDISPELLAMADAQPSAAVCECDCCKAQRSISRPTSRMGASTRWSSPGHCAASPMLGRLSSRRTACSAPMARFALSSMDDRPTPRWLGGRTVSPRCGGAARVVVI
jgi:hypothetical protein